MPHSTPIVLLAEDDDELRELLAARITREGMRVIELEDGYELRDYLQLCRPGGTVSDPDVVITDWQMPGENGLDAIRHSPPLHAPLVLISSFTGPLLRAAAAELGAVACFEKPIDLDLLVQAIRRVLVI